MDLLQGTKLHAHHFSNLKRVALFHACKYCNKRFDASIIHIFRHITQGIMQSTLRLRLVTKLH